MGKTRRLTQRQVVLLTALVSTVVASQLAMQVACAVSCMLDHLPNGAPVETQTDSGGLANLELERSSNSTTDAETPFLAELRPSDHMMAFRMNPGTQCQRVLPTFLSDDEDLYQSILSSRLAELFGTRLILVAETTGAPLDNSAMLAEIHENNQNIATLESKIAEQQARIQTVEQTIVELEQESAEQQTRLDNGEGTPEQRARARQVMDRATAKIAEWRDLISKVREANQKAGEAIALMRARNAQLLSLSSSH